jgi:hypothetical protein
MPAYASACLSAGRTFPVEHQFLQDAVQHTGHVVNPNGPFAKKTANRREQKLLDEDYRRLAKEHGHELSRHTLKQIHVMDEDKLNIDLIADLVWHLHRQACEKGDMAGR